jgi:predicted nucleic acid-binding protein
VIVLDASVLIAHLNRDDAHHARARACLLDAADHTFAATSITLAEVFVGPIRTGRLASAQTALRALGVTELPLPTHAAERLAVLRAETGLKLPDCCVLLVAREAECQVLTFDDRLAREADRLSADG